MRLISAFLVLAAVCVAAPATSHAREPWKSKFDRISTGDEDVEVGGTYRVRVDELRPTQFAVGMDEVNDRYARIHKMGKDEFRKYLKDKVGSVVIGPGGELYLVDGHHLALALTHDGRPQMLVKVLDDWSHLTQEEFYARMIRRKRLGPTTRTAVVRSTQPRFPGV